MRNAPAFELRNLRKVYPAPEVVANDGITFTVEPGEAFGLLGPNGAGKTTLVRQLVGLLRPTSGEVRLFGEVVDADRADLRAARTVAYLPQGSMGMGEIRVAEAIAWTAMLRGVGRRRAESETEELLTRLELEGLADRQLRKLSSGQRRLAQIGMTLVGRLPVMILDEPTADIDPALRRRIWDLISSRARAGTAVLLVTHDVSEAEHVLDRVAILDRGSIVASGTPGQLKARLAHRTRLEVVLSEDSSAALDAVAADIGGEVRTRGRRISAWVPADEAVRRLEKVMSSAAEGALEDVRLVTPTLEDVYLDIGGRSLEEGDLE